MFVIVAHPGRQSDMWVNKNPGNYYLTDFFAEDGTGALQKALADLKKQNKEYSFEGLFWFQGEASEDRNATEKWKNNLLGMIASIRKDLGDSHWKYVVSVIDINPAFTTPADTANTNALREVMLALPSVDPKAIAADSRGYERVDAWHLKRETGAREFGAAAAKAFLTSVRDANK